MPELTPEQVAAAQALTAKQVAELVVKEVVPVIKADVEKMVGEIVEERVRKAAEKNPDQTASMRDLVGEGAPAQRDPEDVPVKVKQRKAARYLLALASARGDQAKAMQIAKDAWGKDGRRDETVIKALGESQLSSGGFMVPPDFGDFIDSLGAKAIVEGILGARKVPMPRGTLPLPRGDSSATLYWVGENQTAGTSQPGGSQVTLTAKKAMVICPLSNDLIRDAGQQAQDWVEREARRAYERGSDLAFIRGVGGENSPRGMLNRAAAANKFQITHAAAVATLQEVYADLGRVVQKLANQNVPLASPGWAVSKRTEWFLKTLLTTVGAPVFMAEMSQGRLWGFPWGSTTQIPNNLNVSGTGANDESELYFADFESVVIGDVGEVEVEVVRGAAYYDTTAGAVVSGLSNDQTTLVLKKRVDFASLYDGKDIAVLQAIDWA